MNILKAFLMSPLGALAAFGSPPASNFALKDMTFAWVSEGCLATTAARDQMGSSAILISEDKLTVSKVELDHPNDPKNCEPLGINRAALDFKTHQYYSIDAKPEQIFAILIPQSASMKIPDLEAIDFENCTTSEGIIFFATNSKNGTLIWSDYMYLGYDVETTCPVDLDFGI